jgi:hypothetical protein
MKASETVALLTDLIREHGDLDVLYETPDSDYAVNFEFEPAWAAADGDGVFLLNIDLTSKR